MKKLLLCSLMAIAIQTQAQNVGIGTPTPGAKLEVVGSGNTSTSNTFLLKNSSANNLLRMQDNGQLFVGEPTVADIRQYKFRVQSGDKGSLFIENPITVANQTVRILRGIPESGGVASTTALMVEASSDRAAIFKGRGGIEVESHFNLIPAGEFTAASAGLALETKGKVKITENLATAATGALLEVEGTTKINGEVNRPSTGAANMVPIAYGMINDAGVIQNGSGNFTVSRSGQTYVITIVGETYSYLNYTTTATVSGTTPRFITVNSLGLNTLSVYIFNTAGTQISEDFTFITYKP